MALEISDDVPTVEEFTLLSAHQQQTPASFFGARAVLHLRCPNAKLRISLDDLSSQPALASLEAEGARESSEDDAEIVISSVDAWVSSRYFKHCVFLHS